MISELHPSEKSRRTILLVLRILLWLIWGSLLFGAFCFTCIMMLIFAGPPPREPPPPEHNIVVLLFVDLVAGALLISLVHAARFVLFRLLAKKSWMTNAVAYPIAKIIAWVVVDAVVFFSLVICLIARDFLPALPVAIAAWLIILADMPLFMPFKRHQALQAACAPVPA